MKYDLVLLDADGTLFDFDSAAAAAFRAACSEIGIAGAEEPSLFGRYHEINRELWTSLERGEIDKESLKVERFRRLFDERGITADAAICASSYLEHLAEGDQLFEGAEDFVHSLSAAGARLAIVTNGISSVQRGRFFRSPLAALIPHLLISEELGAEKPAAAFFSEAFKRLGRSETEKDGVVVVGDSWTADIEGALGFGVDALWFNPKRSPRPSTDPRDRSPALYEAASYEAALDALIR
jgi:YjjG family noncanonical pyrimidine nucleotidase